MVRIVAQATSGVEPKWVMMAPVGAVAQIWQKTGWKNEDVDLYELNEAFSVQALGVMRELGLNPERSMSTAEQWRSATDRRQRRPRAGYADLRNDPPRREARNRRPMPGRGNAVAMAVERP